MSSSSGGMDQWFPVPAMIMDQSRTDVLPYWWLQIQHFIVHAIT
jgi:hypothetical protein